MEYELITIHLWGIRIDEPITTFTDLWVSAVCYYAFYQISKHRPDTRLFQFMKYYFLSMGLATTIGGLIGHGFLYALSFGWKLPGWLTSMFSIALLERGSIEYAKPQIDNPKLFSFFSWLNIIELITFVIITFSTLNFFFVEVHSAYGLLIVVTGFQGYIYWHTSSEASKLALIGVAFAALSALFYMNQWGLHTWFNHFAMSHTFMTFAAWYFYKSTMAMEIREADPKEYLEPAEVAA
jgi:hypothetical protein